MAMQTTSRLISVLFLIAAVATAGEPSEDIYASRESWVKALGNPKLLKNPAFAYVETDPDLPRVLLYGDSISIGYTPYVRELLDGVVTVQRIPCNGGDTASGFAKLKQAGMEKGKWDVIHFNWGLHDLKYLAENGRSLARDPEKGTQVRSVEEYERNLERLVALLQSSGARLVFATTTPVPPGSAGRREGDAKRYNESALRVMQKHGIAVNDLYGLVYPKLKEYQRPANVHFLPEGSKAMARQVALEILKALVRKQKPSR
jgi:acyl-CoA thioesterase-1